MAINLRNMDQLSAIVKTWPIDIQGKWSERQAKAIQSALQHECARSGVVLDYVEITCFKDEYSQFIFVVRWDD